MGVSYTAKYIHIKFPAYTSSSYVDIDVPRLTNRHKKEEKTKQIKKINPIHHPSHHSALLRRCQPFWETSNRGIYKRKKGGVVRCKVIHLTYFFRGCNSFPYFFSSHIRRVQAFFSDPFFVSFLNPQFLHFFICAFLSPDPPPFFFIWPSLWPRISHQKQQGK